MMKNKCFKHTQRKPSVSQLLLSSRGSESRLGLVGWKQDKWTVLTRVKKKKERKKHVRTKIPWEFDVFVWSESSWGQ